MVAVAVEARAIGVAMKRESRVFVLIQSDVAVPALRGRVDIWHGLAVN